MNRVVNGLKAPVDRALKLQAGAARWDRRIASPSFAETSGLCGKFPLDFSPRQRRSFIRKLLNINDLTFSPMRGGRGESDAAPEMSPGCIPTAQRSQKRPARAPTAAASSGARRKLLNSQPVGI